MFVRYFFLLLFTGLMFNLTGCGPDDAGPVFSIDDTLIPTPFKDDPTHRYEVIRMETNFGEILIWLYYQTPKHRENFMKLTNEGFYDGLTFHRVIRNFVIQGGDPLGNGTGGPGYTIEQEIKSFIRHGYGAVAAARTGDAVNPTRASSGSQFYIVQNSQGTPFLDLQYTVFGQVIRGMETVEAIAAVQTGPGDRPINPVTMDSVSVVTYTADELREQFAFGIPF